MQPLKTDMQALLTERREIVAKPEPEPCQHCAGTGWIAGNTPCLSCTPIETLKAGCGLYGEPLPGEDWSWFNPELQAEGLARKEAEYLQWSLEDWVAGKGKRWLVISGKPGIGKSDLVKTAIWLSFKQRFGGSYLTAYQFDRNIKRFGRETEDAATEVFTDPDRWVEQLAKTSRLAIDDIGSGYVDRSGYDISRFERLFDLRYRYKLPTIITTNMPRPEFEKHVGYRVTSRLWDTGLSEVIACRNMIDVRPDKR